MAFSHLVYGLRVVSDLPLPCLAILQAVAPVDLHIRLKERTEFGSRFGASRSVLLYTSPYSDSNGEPGFRVCTFDEAAYFGFFYSDGARFAVECEGREIWADWPDGYSLEDTCTYLIGPVIAFALRLRGAICLHASSIAIDNRAIALLGAPGAGKSTTAAAFARMGFPVLSDDVAVLADQGNRFLVQPGYPRVNLWPDSVRVLFGSKDSLPQITPTWEKRYLALDQGRHRFQSEPLPLGAVYILGERESELAHPIVEEVVAREVFMTLVANAYVNYLLTADMRRREFDLFGRLVAEVPVRRVRPARDPSKLFELCEIIAADSK